MRITENSVVSETNKNDDGNEKVTVKEIIKTNITETNDTEDLRNTDQGQDNDDNTEDGSDDSDEDTDDETDDEDEEAVKDVLTGVTYLGLGIIGFKLIKKIIN